MNDLFTDYTDQAFLDFLSSFIYLAPAGLILSLIVFFAGWLVAWVITLLRQAV